MTPKELSKIFPEYCEPLLSELVGRINSGDDPVLGDEISKLGDMTQLCHTQKELVRALIQDRPQKTALLGSIAESAKELADARRYLRTLGYVLHVLPGNPSVEEILKFSRDYDLVYLPGMYIRYKTLLRGGATVLMRDREDGVHLKLSPNSLYE